MCLHDAADVLIEVRGWKAAHGQMGEWRQSVGGVFGVYMFSFTLLFKLNWSAFIVWFCKILFKGDNAEDEIIKLEI